MIDGLIDFINVLMWMNEWIKFYNYFNCYYIFYSLQYYLLLVLQCIFLLERLIDESSHSSVYLLVQ